MNILTRSVICVLVLGLRAAGGAQNQSALPEDLEKNLARVRAEWNVPGLAVGILRGNSVLLARGYGVLTAGGRDSVNEHTLFAVASLTKAFTAALIGKMVDHGKLRWDDPVQMHLPWFQMFDSWVSREMTVRDLLCHRSGLHTFGGDLLWYGTTYSRENVVRRIRFLRPRHGFRETYGYQNVMFIAAGEIIEEVSGRSWDDVIRDSVFAPLGMSRSTTRVRDLDRLSNVATPHIDRNGRSIQVPYRDVDNAGPAAAVNSTVHDLLLWARTWLRSQGDSGVSILSTRSRHELWSPHTPLRLPRRVLDLVPERHFYAAGLGWFLYDYAGRLVVTHGGAMDGMLSQFVLLPEEGYAVIVLTNSDGSPVGAIASTIVDALLGRKGRDWLGEAQRRKAEADQRLASKIEGEEARRNTNTKPSLPTGRYAGVYRSEMYGDVRVDSGAKGMVLHFLPTPSFVADLTHWQYDTFRITLRDPVLPEGRATFVLDASGVPAELRIDIPNPDFDFTELELKRVAEQD